MRAGLVTYLVVVHAAAILLFSRGFFLNRLALTDVSKHGPNANKRPQQTHKRAVVLIIDALRFDFISPTPPEPQNPYHHNVLQLPAELTRTRPGHSFIFNAYADPPTTTLQRIKAITTGSLPTFVDMGSNFGGGSAILEDSIVKQLRLMNKTIAFMGEDTWLSVYPTSFHPNLTFPYDGFNIEDLHTVDTGVLTHLFPLLLNSHPGLSHANQVDFVIGHFLGVDHVGHRVGPSHPSMHAKLTQMDTALRQVVDLLDDDTLLVVLGDHGMDRAGDHGGDGILETSSALWIYSKGPPLMDKTLSDVFSGLIEYKMFPGTTTLWRSVQQIDLLPTLCLLLGLPIPYSNLGSVIPELFWRSSSAALAPSVLELEKALNLNSHQIHQYLSTYRSSSTGSELDFAWASLQSTWDAIKVAPQLSLRNAVETKLIAMSTFNRSALSACRAIWAQFNPLLMAAGLALMVTTILTTFIIYITLRSCGPDVAENFLSDLMPRVFKTTMMADTVVAGAFRFLVPMLIGVSRGDLPMNTLETGLFAGPMMGCVVMSVSALIQRETFSRQRRSFSRTSSVFAVLILLLHTISFFSNSFTFWEDKIVLWLCATSMVPFLLWGASSPGLSFSSVTSKMRSATSGGMKGTSLLTKVGLTTLRGKTIGFTFLFLLCIRLISLVTACREEQGAFCHVTFYATSMSPIPIPPIPADSMINPSEKQGNPASLTDVVTISTTPPNWSLVLSLPITLILPSIVMRILKVTKSDSGIAPVIIWSVVTPALIASWVFWMLEWVESGGLNQSNAPLLKTIEAAIGVLEGPIKLRVLRSWIARGVFFWIALGTIGWWLLPLCLDIRISAPSPTALPSSATSAPTATLPKTQVSILGYANSYGASFLMFYLLMFSLVYMCTPLPGQIVLGLAAVALVSYMEVLDGIRGAKEIERVVERTLNPSQISSSNVITAVKTPSAFNDARNKNIGRYEEETEPTTLLTSLPLILLTFITFYATGHQCTISSMQWKTGLILTESVKYPWSLVSLVLNTMGPFFLLGIAGGALSSGWKRSPTSSLLSSPSSASLYKDVDGPLSIKDTGEEGELRLGQDIEHSSLLSVLLLQLYFLMLLFGTSMSAAILRRHLMVWKVFAPRFVAAVFEIGVVDLGVCLSVWLVVGRVVSEVEWVLGRVWVGKGGVKRGIYTMSIHQLGSDPHKMLGTGKESA